jgi:hypothetical protein
LFFDLDLALKSKVSVMKEKKSLQTFKFYILTVDGCNELSLKDLTKKKTEIRLKFTTEILFGDFCVLWFKPIFAAGHI